MPQSYYPILVAKKTRFNIRFQHSLLTSKPTNMSECTKHHLSQAPLGTGIELQQDKKMSYMYAKLQRNETECSILRAETISIMKRFQHSLLTIKLTTMTQGAQSITSSNHQQAPSSMRRYINILIFCLVILHFCNWDWTALIQGLGFWITNIYMVDYNCTT